MQRLIVLLPLFFCAYILKAQQPLQQIRKKSHQTFLYKISADTAEKYLRKGIKEIDHYLQVVPDMEFHADSVDYKKIPIGNYLFISVEDSLVSARYFSNTATLPFIINNQVKPQLLLRNESGDIFGDAIVYADGQKLKLNDATKTYILENKRPDEILLRIERPGDTSFAEIAEERENYLSIKKQRWKRFKSTLPGRMIAWLPDRINYMVKNKPRYWFRKRYRNKNYKSQGKGYVLFNKPKYFPKDSIQLKAYIVNKKGRQVNKPLHLWLNYTPKNASIQKKITELKPATPGAYVYSFATGDTLPNDTRYTLQFKNKKGRAVLSGNFEIEDYVLDEVASYNIMAQNTKYYAGDTMQLSASAKDANGLALMDGKVKLLLLGDNISDVYAERVFVPDTLFQMEKNLVVEGDTKFLVPTDNFPQADMSLRAVAVFRNSNNEIQEKSVDLNYWVNNKKIAVEEEDGMIKASFIVNGKSTPAEGWMENDLMNGLVPVNFPYIAKIDPQAEDYYFYSVDMKLKQGFDIANNYKVNFSRRQFGDTVSFLLSNYKRVTVYYQIFDKDKEIFSASSTDEKIIWADKIPNGRVYYLRWQYYWAGHEQQSNESLALLSKLAATEIGGASTIYPGQKDTIAVKVKDYRKRPLPNMNITAVSYNSQFANDIRVPEPPYIQKFKGKQPLLRHFYEVDDYLQMDKKFSLGKHQGWLKKFALDTMTYYQFLFPDKHYQMVKTRIENVLPQASVYAVQNGVPQEVYLVYMNRQLVYYNGVTNKSTYATTRMPGYTQFMIRTKDKLIITDSIYLQPYYKHDIVFDLDKNAPNYKVSSAENFWSWQEKEILNKQLLRVENNYRNNYGYVWQDEKAYYLGSNGEHVVGPFVNNDSIQFYKPGDFDFRFNFEPGYRYRISPNVVRLEKSQFISTYGKVYLPTSKTAWWPLGDTITDLAAIKYTKQEYKPPFLEQTGSNYQGNALTSKIKLLLPNDSSYAFTVLQNNNNESDYKVFWSRVDVFNNISRGNYTVVLMTVNHNYLQAANINVDTVGTYCIKFVKDANNKLNFSFENAVVQNVIRLQEMMRIKNKAIQDSIFKLQAKKNELYKQPEMTLPLGNASIAGKVVDGQGGSGIPGVSVMIKGTKTGTTTDGDGNFRFNSLPDGGYVLQVAGIGYYTADFSVSVVSGQSNFISISLKASENRLSEVVVVGYGTAKRKDLTGSVAKVTSADFTDLAYTFSGKANGVNINGSGGMLDSATRIQIRGFASFDAAKKPLIVIDGVPYDEMPEGVETESMTVLKDASATALYGSRANDGVIVITTKGNAPKMMRDEFRDYAYWQPNLITDENGEVKFTVTYPDNITSWQTYVLGMDKQNHITKATKLVKSYKPMLAQLSAPQFLVEGDSAVVIGKKLNYTTSPVDVNVEFTVNSKTQLSANETIKANDAAVSELPITATTSTDTIIARLTMKATTGFSDGELRKLPVLKRGTTETVGQFYILDKDTSFNFIKDEEAGSIKLYAQNNTFDLLLDEIEYLKKYPYYCMEQTASKLTGLAMEKKIREALKQNFKSEKELSKLMSKLQKGQLFDGSWGWWEGSKANINITNYVLRALLQFRGDALLETNIRNGLLYLHNQLPQMNKYDLLESLTTLSDAKHDMDYSSFLKRLTFDSLSQHQQWQMVAILQQQKLAYAAELETLMKKKTATMLGGSHWGDKNFWWYGNDIATTVLAYKTLSKITGYEAEQKKITQYFLEQRREGHWRNTVESATILSALLPDVLKENANFTTNAELKITGDTTITVSKFPFEAKLHGKSINNILVAKQGGGLVYFTAYRQIFNTNPTVVDSNFIIKTYFEDKNGVRISNLKAGEKTVFQVSVDVLKDADYVQLEIPVPAGCTFGTKGNYGWNEHREYFRDRVLIFVEKLNKGKYNYQIELEPRYNGAYTMNPARAELMYFPVFFGRNGVQKIEIKK